MTSLPRFIDVLDNWRSKDSFGKILSSYIFFNADCVTLWFLHKAAPRLGNQESLDEWFHLGAFKWRRRTLEQVVAGDSAPLDAWWRESKQRAVGRSCDNSQLRQRSSLQGIGMKNPVWGFPWHTCKYQSVTSIGIKVCSPHWQTQGPKAFKVGW